MKASRTLLGDARSDAKSFSFESFRGRLRVVLGFLALACVGLVARAAHLQLIDQQFYAKQGNARFMRETKLAAHRGAILDRNGEPMAASTPVDTVWANPRELKDAMDQLPRLAEAMNRDGKWLTQLISSNLDREFVYLKRHMPPQDAVQVAALKIPGVYLRREYRRYYPASEVAGHVLGFTNIDDVGQEGLELAFDHTLGGETGEKRVIRDLHGNTVEDVESIRAARPGTDLVTSIDMRIQYLAYRELKAAVAQHRARSGSVVILDVATGEVLAIVNQPSFNPNDREQRDARVYKNRAATDIIEPGSSIKPFVAAAGLASGKYTSRTLIDTSPGFVQVGIKRIPDHHNLGKITLTTVLAESSNVGMAKMAMNLGRDEMWQMLDAFGFGQNTGSGYPGESAGMLPPAQQWRQIDQATRSYGYGLAVTPLQLAHAYSILGAGGVNRPVSLRRVDVPVPGVRVIEEQLARDMLRMMEQVVSENGTGKQAALISYRVAGKTGTAWKAKEASAGYDTDRYVATFGGVVPASNPRLAAIVMIDEPRGDAYYGGDVAAPVFANVMAGALRLLGVPADNLDNVPRSNYENTLLLADEALRAPGARNAGAASSTAAGARTRATAAVGATQ
jgi:cell division protein FtsI (penicillin-binding protein 3)